MKQKKAEDFPKKVSNWPQLADLIEHFSRFNGYDWLFRGVTKATHEPIPKIGRPKIRKRKKQPGSSNYVHLPYNSEDERAVLTMFKQQARPYLESPPATNSSGWQSHNTTDCRRDSWTGPTAS